MPSPPPDKGINIIGFIYAEMGIGESARLAARSAEAAGIPFGMLDYPIRVSERMSDASWSHKEIQTPIYPANVFHINADFMSSAIGHFGSDLTKDRYNIGYWHWELPDFPDEFSPSFELVQEIWTCSTFTAEAIARKTSLPVLTIPHGVAVPPLIPASRTDFGLPQERFLFLVMYDAQSSALRKNPQAAVDAFRLAFEKHHPDVGLVIKLNNGDFRPQDSAPLRQLAAERDHIYLIDKAMSRNEVYSLLQCVDCFVSLHRAEGFGLGLAEAMYLGKPVIGTGWSGNTDFMTTGNSCPVDYRLVKVGQDWGPYKGYQTWAEADVRHAADYMRRLVSDRAWRQAIAANGMRTIRESFSPAVSGRMMRSRLQSLSLL
ncbi:glycosyltransferase family 4 protein [Paenibacillus sp. NPDC058071]|uniref:glycosyltransferase family 4 protein n=1 Tax=Paenibacillus sp. NPDC058071 TaxID=3346326 RepID=UPI0036D872DA